MRKYIIRDEGEEYEVKEFERGDFLDEGEDVIEEKVESFTPDEIVILKKILPHVDKLLDLVSEEEEEVADKDEEVAETEEEITDEDPEEEVIESEKIDTRDSKSSFGAIEIKSKKVKDNFDTSIDDAWAKRYNGGKK